ncbi:MAG: hypothetical protein IJJ09_02905, partial [Synergistaceae bacterium]|nr:hypothetical protein [Synergistaceae bacterium]
MKKFFAAMILIFVISSVSYGAENKDGEYIRKEVFDARMDRMEALLEKTVYEIKIENEKFRAENEKFRSEIKADIQNLASDVKVLEIRVTELDKRMDTRFSEMDKRISGLERTVYWILTVVGLVLALVALPRLKEIAAIKPSINLTDVEHLVKRL